MGSSSYEKLKKTKNGISWIIWLMLLGILVGGGVLASKLFELEMPQITLSPDAHLLGRHSKLELVFTDAKSGIRDLKVSLRQGDKHVVLVRRQFSKSSLLEKGPVKVPETIGIDAMSLGLADGRADLMVTVHDFSVWHWGKGNETSSSYPLIFDTKSPKLRLLDSPSAIRQGSAGIIVYRANEEIVRHGVTINGYFHPGFPLPARGEGVYGAMIGIPYDMETITEAKISAYDRAGNSVEMPFSLNIRKVKKHKDRINISESFLKWKIPEFAQYYPDMKGDLVAKYIYINNVVRIKNATTIRGLCRHSSPERMWKGTFERMRRSARRAGFADYRAYYYKGKVIDHQVHKGVDLASVRHARVEAANGGKVVYADYLGIYGNMVIIDHGQGVFSLYGHLSQIKVAPGDLIKKGGLLGISGSTGMAGGDHLHFAILVDGIFVNPLDWWDTGWLRLNIEQYLK